MNLFLFAYHGVIAKYPFASIFLLIIRFYEFSNQSFLSPAFITDSIE